MVMSKEWLLLVSWSLLSKISAWVLPMNDPDKVLTIELLIPLEDETTCKDPSPEICGCEGRGVNPESEKKWKACMAETCTCMSISN